MQKIELVSTQSFKYLQTLTLIFITVMLVGAVVSSKIIKVFGYDISSGMLLMPIWWSIADIVAEVFGYKASQKLVWTGLACQALFVLLCYSIVQIHSPHAATEEAFQFVRPMLFALTAGLIGLPFAIFINTYCISRWKILTRGQWFFWRSLVSTFIGVIVFAVITTLIVFGKYYNTLDLTAIIIFSIIYKLFVDPICALISTIVVFYLKKYGDVDVFDIGISYNPFKA